jgi:fatty-acid desaturase
MDLIGALVLLAVGAFVAVAAFLVFFTVYMWCALAIGNVYHRIAHKRGFVRHPPFR